MDHTTVSRLQHVLQAYIMHCVCRWNDFVILSLQEPEKELKAQGCGTAASWKVLQQENFPTGFLTGKIGSMIKGLAGHYVQVHKGGFQRAPFWMKSARSASSTWPLFMDRYGGSLAQNVGAATDSPDCRFDMGATCDILLIITVTGVTERCQRLDELNKSPILESIQNRWDQLKAVITTHLPFKNAPFWKFPPAYCLHSSPGVCHCWTFQIGSPSPLSCTLCSLSCVTSS